MLFVLFGLIERHRQDPLLELALLRRPVFAAALATALLMNAAAFAYLPYTSLWLQTVVGLGPIRAGLRRHRAAVAGRVRSQRADRPLAAHG